MFYFLIFFGKSREKNQDVEGNEKHLLPKLYYLKQKYFFLLKECQKFQNRDLLNLLKFIVLRIFFWHDYLENTCCFFTEQPKKINSCVSACPYCLNNTKDYSKQERRDGLSKFLAECFIRKPDSNCTPQNCAKVD